VAEALATLRDIEREIASLRIAPGSDTPYQRTSVATHTVWVPEEWVAVVEDILSRLAERHPSRTIVLFPQPEQEDGIEGEVSVDSFPVGGGRQICTEVIRLKLNGKRAAAPASIIQPLFLPNLPVFMRWRGVPDFRTSHFEGLVDVVDRLIVDSSEWPGLPGPYDDLADIFDRVVVSDISWARTGRWRLQLAGLWPKIAGLERLRVKGTTAQAYLLAGWLSSRLRRKFELEHEPAERLEGVDIDGEPAPFPAGEAPSPVDLLSDELDKFNRDPIYEDAVRAAAEF